MKVYKEKLPRDTKSCYAVTAWMLVERKDSGSGEVVTEESYDDTIEVDSVLDAVLIMIAIDYMTEKKMEITHMVDHDGYYLIDKFSKLFDVRLECEESESDYRDYTYAGDCWYDGCRTIKFEYGQEAYEITLDMSDPFVAKVRDICDRIMKEYDRITTSGNDEYWSIDFLKDLMPEAREIKSEVVEFVK